MVLRETCVLSDVVHTACPSRIHGESGYPSVDSTNYMLPRPADPAYEKSPAFVAGLSTAGIRADSGRARGSSLGAQGVPLFETPSTFKGHGVPTEVGAFPLSSATSSAAGRRSRIRATLSPA